jgi:hypothetical protein
MPCLMKAGNSLVSTGPITTTRASWAYIPAWRSLSASSTVDTPNTPTPAFMASFAVIASPHPNASAKSRSIIFMPEWAHSSVIRSRLALRLGTEISATTLGFEDWKLQTQPRTRQVESKHRHQRRNTRAEQRRSWKSRLPWHWRASVVSTPISHSIVGRTWDRPE